MTCIEGLLQQLTGEVEGQVQQALSGFWGFVVRGYLPQVWTFTTETDSATLIVDSNGRARVSSGTARQPDVTVNASHRLAAAALGGDRRTAGLYGNEAHVTTRTQKGAAAWAFLRQRLGF